MEEEGPVLPGCPAQQFSFLCLLGVPGRSCQTLHPSSIKPPTNPNSSRMLSQLLHRLKKKKKKNPWIPFSQNLIMQKKTCAQHNENILLNGVREKWHTQVYASDTPRYRSDVTTGTQPSGHVRKDKLGIMRHEVRKQDLSAWKWKEFLRQPLALHQLSNG